MRGYPEHLLKLIQVLKKLPGIGNRSAERFAFNLLSWSPEHLNDFGETVKQIFQRLQQCKNCGCLIGEQECQFCDINKRNAKMLCVIASPRDAFSIEETHEYRGLYHVLNGLLSPIDRRGPELLRIAPLKQRIANHNVEEVVLALDSTLEGDATALYIKQELALHSLRISRLAFGLPIGSHIDYVDGGTLARAFLGRSQF